ncbi:MAG: hypothetical protein KC421_10310 [Anaerolineales bacterium]|nr:hypothetical protein [Anaerolineales bacterium]
MSKRLTFLALTIAGFAGLGIGTWQYRRYWEWLNTRGLDGPAFLGLIFLGILVLIMPVHLRGMWDQITPLGMVREFVVKGGLMMGVVTALVLVLLLIVLLVSLPARLGRPALILPWLTLLVPLAITVIDLAKGNCARTVANFFTVFVLYTFRIYGMLAIQFTFIPLAFAIFPAGFFLQFLGIVDFVARQFGRFIGERPWLCEWGNINQPACTPALLGFHIGHLLLVVVALKYGQTLFDAAADRYRVGLEWLAARIEKKHAQEK